MFDKFLDPVFLNEYKTSKKYEEIREAYLGFYNKSNVELKALLFSKFRMFAEVGERNAYENSYNEHMNKLLGTAYMSLIYGDEKYIRELEDCLYDILSVYVWALPAHIPDINSENYYELDLASCTLGSTLALIYHLLGKKIHPQLRKRIKTELRRRILNPFKKQIWHWEDRYNNWTSVCAGFTGITIMLVFPKEFDKLLPRFDENMRKYYEGFPDDGVCLEGPGYWGYGFVSLLAYAVALREYTNGERDYFKLEKTKKIALFYQNTMLDTDVLTTYGDCPMDVKTNAALLYTLKKMYGDEYIMPTKSRHALPVNPLIHVLLYIDSYDPRYDEDAVYPCECYMQSAGWYIKRSEKYAIGAKGGTNGESHNHNDVGSFIVSKDNRQVLIDIGVRPYTRDYFTDIRYEKYLEPSSRSHNVPIINGKYQANVRGTRSYTKLENGIFEIDFKELYDVKELKKLVRQIAPKESSIIIKDSFEIDGKATFTERLVSYAEPKINDGEIIIDNLSVTFDKSLANARYEKDIHVVALDEDGSIKESKDVYLISIDVNEPNGYFEFKINC